MKSHTKAVVVQNRFAVLAMFCGLGLSALVPTVAGADQTPSKDMKSMPMDHSKMEGMKHMDGMSMTGDVDHDFAANMKMHHQMGIDMAKTEIKNGKDPKMVKMAKAIVATQTKESSAFDKYLAAHKSSMPDGMKMPEKEAMPEGMSMPDKKAMPDGMSMPK